MRKSALFGLGMVLATLSVLRAQPTDKSDNPPPKHGSAASNGLFSADESITNTIVPYRQTWTDRKLQRQLVGTWTATWGEGQTTTNVIAKDGSYSSSTQGAKGPAHGYSGTFLVKKGVVENRVKFGARTFVTHLHILQLNSHELVWSNDNGGMATFKRVRK